MQEKTIFLIAYSEGNPEAERADLTEFMANTVQLEYSSAAAPKGDEGLYAAGGTWTHFLQIALPVAGIVGKKVVEVAADAIMKWIKSRPKIKVTSVELYGSNGEVIKVVKREEKVSIITKL